MLSTHLSYLTLWHFQIFVTGCLAQVSISPPLTTIKIPENRFLEGSLGYTEDSYLNFTELATKYNYPYTEYSVNTEDGYILKLFRFNGNRTQTATKRTPLFLMHGVPDTADTWIVSKPQGGLGYILADEGYDVWFGNNRGNRYSRKHQTLNPDTDAEFWDFTFHQIGVYDLPAMIDFVLQQTGSQQLAYIGHSQGTTDFFVLGSTRPEYNAKIRIAALMAPVAWVDNISSPVVQALAAIQDEIYLSFRTLGFEELFGTHGATAVILRLLCQYLPQTVCGSLIYSFTAYDSNKYTPDETLSTISGHYPAGTSLDNIKRFGQGVRENRFRRFDYGATKNLVKYGTAEAADYNLTALTAPVALFCGKQDWLVNLIDAEKLRVALSNLTQFTVMPQYDWSHFDYTWSRRVPTDVKPNILDLLQRYNV